MSRPNEIASALCSYIEGLNLGVTPIITPNNDPTPSGKYIAVRIDGIEQVCGYEKPKPTLNKNEGDTRFEMTCTIVFTEVDGDGTALATIREWLQVDDFKAIEDANDFAVWDISDVMNNDLQDGDEWIYSKMFTASINYTDIIKHSAQKVASIEGWFNGIEFNFNLEDEEMAHIVAQLPINYTLTGSARDASASPASDAFLEPKIVSSANGIIDYTFGNKITTITGAKLTTIGGVGANANTLVAASIVLKIGTKDVVLTFSSLNEWEKKEISLQTNDYDQMKIMSTSEISVDDYNVQDAFVGESITAKLELIMD